MLTGVDALALVGSVGELYYHHGHLPPNWFEGLPHMATNDDGYDGYYIPKWTVLLGNAWQVRSIILTFWSDSVVYGHDARP